MVKEKRILSYFIGWLIIGFIICFLGITKTFAATYYMNYQYLQQYYDNYGSNVTQVTTTWMDSFNSYISSPIGTTANSYGAGISISSPMSIIENHTYTLSIYFEEINNIALSSKNHLAISTGLYGAATNYANGNYYVDMVQSNVNSDTILQFVFTANGHGSFIFIPWTTTYNTTQDYVLTQITMEDLGSEGISQEDINNSLNNQTNILNNSIQSSTNIITDSITDTENNINSNIDDMEDAIVESNKETQDVIKDQFNSCRDSYNLLDLTKAIYGGGSNITANILSSNSISFYIDTSNPTYAYKKYMLYLPINTYLGKNLYSSFKVDNDYGRMNFGLYDSNYNLIGKQQGTNILIPSDTEATYIGLQFYPSYGYEGSQGQTITFSEIMISDKVISKYEPYGEEICTNKLDEQNETIKGGFSSIGNWFKELGDKIGNFFENLLNGILDGLKSLFIPEDGYFELWFIDLKIFFEDKLGFLATPFTIIIDFVNRYLDLNSSEDIIINIPDITVPNFEEHIIVKATTFNWSQLLRSKESLNILWELYLAFIDVFLILNFINLCENKYNRIFGGDTTQYEYYTVEDSYNVDINTGEVKNMRRNERKTTRKKVN